MIPEEYSFTRYLKAKQGIDDRALNRQVWEAMAGALPESSPGQPVKIVEFGSGIGTMVARMVDWGLLRYAEYTAIDHQEDNISAARKFLREWAEKRDLRIAETQGAMTINGENTGVKLNLFAADLHEFLEAGQSARCDLVVAHAFLDLVNLPDTLEKIFTWVQPPSLFYFTINYDGLTILEPVIDGEFDRLVLSLYDSTMKERSREGIQFGDHQTGRHLFEYITESGGKVLAAGGSDWVVFPGPAGYPGDEAYFLHFIIETIYQAIKDHPQLDQRRFLKWINNRHDQVERGKLVYVAHQMDFFASNRRDS